MMLSESPGSTTTMHVASCTGNGTVVVVVVVLLVDVVDVVLLDDDVVEVELEVVERAGASVVDGAVTEGAAVLVGTDVDDDAASSVNASAGQAVAGAPTSPVPAPAAPLHAASTSSEPGRSRADRR